MGQKQLYLEMGGDFVLNNNGGLLLADGWDVIRQNFERFIFTKPAGQDFRGNPTPADWIFNPSYGLGASALIGTNFVASNLPKLEQKIYQGALSAATGNSTTPPVVTVTQGSNPQQINATVVISPTGQQQQTLQVNLP